MDIWQPIDLPEDAVHLWRIGPASLWVVRTAMEWHVAIEYLEDQDMGPLESSRQGETPDGVEWRRWAGVERHRKVRVTPVMPDLPAEVRPETPVGLPKGSDALFFVSVPVWLRVSVGEGEGVQLCELPSEVLSRAWFGEPTSGELCYSLTTRARREYDSPPTPLSRAVCPVRIRNESGQQLDLVRLCVRVGHLSTHASENRLWTNLVTMRFRGTDHVAQVDYEPGPPTWEKVGAALAAPRAPVTRGMLKRSFSGFRNLAGF